MTRSGLSGRTLFGLGIGVLLVAAMIFWLAHLMDNADAQVRGAAALPEQPVPQESAKGIQPAPEDAKGDRSRIVSDGCLTGVDSAAIQKPCLYGDPKGSATLILFGDSHAMQYFPPLEQIAQKQHLRLIMLAKRECSPGEVLVRNDKVGGPYLTCEGWRRDALHLIESAGDNVTVVMSGESNYIAYGDGKALSGEANAKALEEGDIATLQRIRLSGAITVVIRDNPESPRGIPRCVVKNPDHVKECAFPWIHDGQREFDVRAAAAVPGVEVIDVTPEICPRDLCRAVIGNALVYRDKRHLTATYARTLKPWIAEGLRQAGVF